MNILLLSWRGIGHPFAGGAEISTHEHAKGWVKAGHHVTIYTAAYKGCKEEELIDGVIYQRSGRQIVDVQLRAFFWYLFSSHPKFDLIIDEFHGIPFFTPLYVRAKKLAFIHEVAKEVWGLNHLPMPFNLVPAILGPLLEPLIFKLFYYQIPFMTVSESTKKDLEKWGIPEKNITVVNNGVSLIKVKQVKKESIKTVTYLGALTKDKGIEDALEVFKILSNKDSKYQFWVVGRDVPYYVDKINQLKKQGIPIKFWGFVSEDKKFELLTRSHVLVNPSIREGWGLTVIEAASVGIPTVGYLVPGLRDSIINGKTGILCIPGDYKDLAKSIMELLESNFKYQNMEKNAIAWSKNFSWEKSVANSLKLIDKVCGSDN